MELIRSVRGVHNKGVGDPFSLFSCTTAPTPSQVFKAIPRSFLSRDPKLKKAAKSAANKAQQRQPVPRSPAKAPAAAGAVAA